MAWRSYVFEAKGIQAYILAGGRLRHIVGGSEIVDRLCRSGQAAALDEIIAQTGLGAVQFLRRAGGVFAFAWRETADSVAALTRFRNLWTLHVQRTAPGLAFTDADGHGATAAAAYEDARRRSAGRRSMPAHHLPLASPLVLRAPRTGDGAVAWTDEKDPVDESLLRKEADEFIRSAAVVQALVPQSHASDWPRDMEEEFPFRGEDRTVAIFHADGNRLGEIVRAYGQTSGSHPDPDEGYCEGQKLFSETADLVTRAALSAASEILVTDREARAQGGGNPRFAARPIVVAGDDVTVLLRADLALEFAQVFLRTFAEQGARLGAALQGLTIRVGDVDHPLPALTACGGLVFCHAKQPFIQAQAIAEDLCKFAKRRAKAFAPERWQTVPTTLAFHRLTGSDMGSYDLQRERGLKASDGRWLSAQPYWIGDPAQEDGAPPLPRLADLTAFVTKLETAPIGRGIFRQMAARLYDDPQSALDLWKRLDERFAPRRGGKSPPEGAEDWTALKRSYSRVMAPLRGAAAAEDVLFADNQTALLDAVTIAQLSRRAAA